MKTPTQLRAEAELATAPLPEIPWASRAALDELVIARELSVERKTLMLIEDELGVILDLIVERDGIRKALGW